MSRSWIASKSMSGWTARWISTLRGAFAARGKLLLESIVLRHQRAVLQRTGTRRPCFRPTDRLFWVLLSRWWVDWPQGLMIVQPATVLRWRRQGLRSIWRSGSGGRWRGGRPRIDGEIRDLIVRISLENFLWGAPRIHGELLKLGFDVSQATVSRYMPRRNWPPSQGWHTFLQNQIVGIGVTGAAGRLTDRLPSLVSNWIEWIVGNATKVRNDLRSALIKLQGTSQPRSRSTNCNRRAITSACIPISRRSAPSRHVCRRPSPYRYRSRARHREGCDYTRRRRDHPVVPSRSRRRNRIAGNQLR